MLPLSPSLLIAAANAFVGLDDSTEDAPGEGSLRAQFLREVRVPRAAVAAAAWHTAFVHHVGYWSHFDGAGRHSSWPLPPTNDPSRLAHFAKREDVLVTLPAPGDIFLLWSPRRRTFVRSGIVERIVDTGFRRNLHLFYDCVTIEGDTDECMSLRGGHTLRHLRTLSSQDGDRFIRWRDIHVKREEGGRRLLQDRNRERDRQRDRIAKSGIAA
jgi:hypothetical protein